MVGCCKTLKYSFSASLVGLVGAGCQKSGLNLKIPPKFVVFASLDPPPKVVTFLIIIAKVRSSQTVFMQKVCFQRVWFELYCCLNGRNWFS